MRAWRAFSLLEMLTALGVLSLLACLSFPLWETFSANTESKLLQATVVQGLETAAQAAETHHLPVTFAVKVENGQRYLKVIANTRLLAEMPLPKHQGALHWRFFPVHRTDLLFLPVGFFHNDNGTFWYCRQKKVTADWAIFVNQTGRARVVYPDAAGNLNDAQGKPLQCV